MSGIDIHISINNVPQFERFNSENNRAPLVHQFQNADMAKGELQQRILMPVEPEELEGKKVDPEDKKQDQNRNKKKKNDDEHKKNDDRKQNRSKSDSGIFIDLEA